MELKSIAIGLVLGIVLSVIGGFYLWNTLPKNNLTNEQIWAGQHTKEIQWTMGRYDKFQKAANDAFFQDNIQNILPSK